MLTITRCADNVWFNFLVLHTPPGGPTLGMKKKGDAPRVGEKSPGDVMTVGKMSRGDRRTLGQIFFGELPT